MRVLVDTCVWSLALRRRKIEEEGAVRKLRNLIEEYRVQMLGPIRQEILSGIRSQAQFEKLREYLRAFPDLPLVAEDYEQAAEFFNHCRQRGIQGSNTDFLLCAVSARRGMPIFTLDDDFARFADHLPIALYPAS